MLKLPSIPLTRELSFASLETIALMLAIYLGILLHPWELIGRYMSAIILYYHVWLELSWELIGRYMSGIVLYYQVW